MRLTYFVLLILILTNCKKSEKDYKQIFSLQFTNDTAIKDMTNFKLNRSYSEVNDTIWVCEDFIKGQHKSEICKLYKREINSIYETKVIYDFDKQPLDTIRILSYSNKVKDTSFIYFYDIQKYPPTKPLGSDDFIYSLRQINTNLFALYQENYSNSSFGELQFYDKDFNIFKIIKIIDGKYYEFINNDVVVKDHKELSECFYNTYLESIKTKKQFIHPYLIRKS